MKPPAGYALPVNQIRLLKHQIDAIVRFARRRFDRSPIRISREPAFDPETAAWFRARIATCASYLEFGGGASTLLAADANIPTVSVESDARFAEALRKAVPAGAAVTVLAPPIGATEDWGYPLWITPTPARVRRWRQYPSCGIEALAKLPVFPELVLVDGRFRRACALHVAAAAQAQGARCEILFDDYAERAHYHLVETALGPPRMIGRAALFCVEGATADTTVSSAMLAAAESDFR